MKHLAVIGDSAHDQVSARIQIEIDRGLPTIHLEGRHPAPTREWRWIPLRDPGQVGLPAGWITPRSRLVDYISGKTGRNRISNVFAKLHLADRAQVIVADRDAGLGRRKQDLRVTAFLR